MLQWILIVLVAVVLYQLHTIFRALETVNGNVKVLSQALVIIEAKLDQRG
jgi:hypothetical protein